jgi:hypothetical protein
MRGLLAAGGLVMAIAIARAGSPIGAPPEAPPGDTQVVELLSGIDYVPTRGTLDLELGGDAAADLIAIARGSAEESSDAGVRIRAYRALSLYPGATTQAALRAGILEHADGDEVEMLYLRAAVDSLVALAGPDAVDDVVPLLDHASRDVRASAAVGLGDTGSEDAVPPLRARLSVEEVGQVRLAIAEALRELE